MPFISISHLARYGTCCHDLEPFKAGCLFFRAGIRVLQKCMLHWSAVARYPDWFTWASPIQTYFSPPPSGEIVPLSLNLLGIAGSLLTPIWPSHICVCPCMGRTEEGGKRIVGRRKWGDRKGLEAAGSQFEEQWRQKYTAMFGVEPKKCVLGKRGARFSINILLSV